MGDMADYIIDQINDIKAEEDIWDGYDNLENCEKHGRYEETGYGCPVCEIKAEESLP